MHTVFLPYIGFQMILADSPGAGVDASSQTQADEEIRKVEELKDRGLVAGVTILKRLVPGWFIKGELGTDLIGAGLALEF